MREWSAISYPNQASWKGGFSPILSWKAPCAWGPPQQGRGDSSSGPDPNRVARSRGPSLPGSSPHTPRPCRASHSSSGLRNPPRFPPLPAQPAALSTSPHAAAGLCHRRVQAHQAQAIGAAGPAAARAGGWRGRHHRRRRRQAGAGAAAPAPRALVAAGAAAAWTRAGVHPSLYHWRHASCALYCQERRKSRAWKGSAN